MFFSSFLEIYVYSFFFSEFHPLHLKSQEALSVVNLILIKCPSYKHLLFSSHKAYYRSDCCILFMTLIQTEKVNVLTMPQCHNDKSSSMNIFLCVITNLLMQAILSACSYKALLCFQNLVTISGHLLQGSNKVTQCLILLVIQVNLHTLMMFLFQSGTFQLGLLIICVQ